MPSDCPVPHAQSISMGSRVTLATVVVALPLVVWATRIDSRVERMEQERVEIRQQLQKINDKLDMIILRIPLVRP